MFLFVKWMFTALHFTERSLSLGCEASGDGQAASRQAAALSEVAVRARPFQTAQTHTGKRGKGEKKKKKTRQHTIK